MVNTRTRYIVYNHGGSGVRHHHYTTSNDIIAEADGHASTGDNLPAQGFPFQWYGGQNVPFAFMSVNGAADGNHLYTSPGNQNVQVGTSDIDILVVYAPPGGFGGPNGGPGVWVDAFNVNAGTFSDDLHFIQIMTPPTPPDTLDAAKTTFANMEGVVSTLTAENFRASVSVDGGVPFLEWKKITPAEILSPARDVALAQNETNEIWFAFYQTIPPDPGIPHLHDELAYALGKWVDDDYCGTGPHPVGPWPGFRIALPKETTRKLNADQKKRLASLSKEYASAAKTAYASMTKVVNLLGELSDMVSKGKSR
jgi:hypothetical protein